MREQELRIQLGHFPNTYCGPNSVSPGQVTAGTEDPAWLLFLHGTPGVLAQKAGAWCEWTWLKAGAWSTTREMGARWGPAWLDCRHLYPSGEGQLARGEGGPDLGLEKALSCTVPHVSQGKSCGLQARHPQASSCSTPPAPHCHGRYSLRSALLAPDNCPAIPPQPGLRDSRAKLREPRKMELEESKKSFLSV